MDNGRRHVWRLLVHAPRGQAQEAELFAWLREWIIPACLQAPIHVTLELVPPEDDASPPST